MDGLPLLVLVFFLVMVMLAFWRLVLMICFACCLTLFVVGLIDVLNWVQDVL